MIFCWPPCATVFVFVVVVVVVVVVVPPLEEPWLLLPEVKLFESNPDENPLLLDDEKESENPSLLNPFVLNPLLLKPVLLNPSLPNPLLLKPVDELDDEVEEVEVDVVEVDVDVEEVEAFPPEVLELEDVAVVVVPPKPPKSKEPKPLLNESAVKKLSLLFWDKLDPDDEN